MMNAEILTPGEDGLKNVRADMLADVERLFGASVQGEFAGERTLPLFLRPAPGSGLDNAAAAAAFFRERRSALEAALDLFGAVVLRDFGLEDTDDFARLIEPWPTHDLGYAGGAAPRPVLQGRVMKATEYRADRPIPLHQEMAYLPHYPSRLAFFCRIAPQTGGETPLGDMRQFTKLVPQDIRDAVENGPLHHERWYAARSVGYSDTVAVDRGWQEAFYTDDRAEVEAKCAAGGMQCEWREDGSLVVRYQIDGYALHPKTQERIWFNQLNIMAPSRRILAEAYDETVARRMCGTTTATSSRPSTRRLSSISTSRFR
jgi:hypothetical protein